MARVALVTGGGRGIGRAISTELARGGTDVAVVYRNGERAAMETVESIRAAGRRAVVLQADIANEGEAGRLVAATVEQFGRLDVLINNAGVLANVPFLDTTPAEYDWQQATNARASFLVTQAAARQMMSQGNGGRIVMVTSEAGDKPVPGLAAYCVSKAAQQMVMKVAATELAEYQITVNAVAPGTTETDMNREMLSNPEMRDILLRDTLLEGPCTPEDIAGAVAFLVSEPGGRITGCTLAVNGGSLIK